MARPSEKISHLWILGALEFDKHNSALKKTVKEKARDASPHLFPRFVFVTKESFIYLMIK